MSRAEDLKFHWKAQFDDGSILEQYKPDGEGRNINEVLDKQDTLNKFWLELQDPQHDLIVGVNMKNGTFFINDFEINTMKGDKDWEPDTEFRLINFRRVRKQFFLHGGAVPGQETDFFVGFQTTVDGKNYQKFVRIGSDGSLSMSV